MSQTQTQDLDKLLNTCIGEIREIEQKNPEEILGRWLQGLPTSQQEKKIVYNHFKSTKLLLDLWGKLQGSSAGPSHRVLARRNNRFSSPQRSR